MKSNDPWFRLAGQARKQVSTEPIEMPAGFDSRLLASLRSGVSESPDFDFNPVQFLRQMAAVSGAILLVSIALNFHLFSQPAENAEGESDLITAVYFGENP